MRLAPSLLLFIPVNVLGRPHEEVRPARVQRQRLPALFVTQVGANLSEGSHVSGACDAHAGHTTGSEC